MTDRLAWRYIAEMGWGTKTVDYKKLGAEWFSRLGEKRMNELRVFVQVRVNDLYAAVGQYEKEHRAFDISDDGMSDLLFHVVGLGKDEFMHAVSNPVVLEERYHSHYSITGCGYKESFAYVFHEPEKELTPELARENRINQMVQTAERLQSAMAIVTNELNTLYSELNKLAKNK